MKLFESKTFLSLRKNVRSVELLVLSSVVVFLVACGGGSAPTPNLGNTPGPVTTTVVTTPTVITPEVPVVTYTPGTKNPGGITYTSGDGSVLDKLGDDKITNNLGVPDRVLTGINNMFPGNDASSTLKRESLTSDTKLYTEILSLTNDKLPKTKAEAELILHPMYERLSFCKHFNTFSNSEVEEVNKRIYLMNLYSKEKIKRYLEILSLGGVTIKFYNC
jgi:hypothetical protein